MASGLPAIVYNPGGGDIPIKFTTPMKTDLFKFDSEANRKDAFTGSGKRQVVFNYIAKAKTLKFRFVTEVNRDLVETMMDTWVLLGNSFLYVPDQDDLLTFFEVQLLDKRWTGSERENLARNEFKFDMRVRQII